MSKKGSAASSTNDREGNSAEGAVRQGHGKVSDQAYEHVRAAVLSGDYPVGTVLAETDLASSLGISRTPVRQALGRLLQEGLVTVGSRRQMIVTRVTPERRHEIFTVREALERIAVTEACKTITFDEIDELRLLVMRARRAADAGNAEDFIDLDEAFHLQIARAARLDLVVKFLEQLRAFVRLMGLEAVVSSKDRMQVVLNEHTAIIDALENRETKVAVSSLEKHLIESEEALSAVAEENEAGGKRSSRRKVKS
ncbi:MAG TPA: GntR family transcriptional regulator [Solirubrobacterales bacterium]|nr:GntR family transcriptional regulator [Solirubrobacterales bacterium]